MKSVVSEVFYERGGIPCTIIIGETGQVQYRIRREGDSYHITRRTEKIPWSDYKLPRKRLWKGNVYDEIKSMFQNTLEQGKDVPELYPHLTGLFAE